MNVNDVSGLVFAGECMCMSLFEFAYLGFEEEWDYLFIFWAFFFQCLGYFYQCNILMFLLICIFLVFSE